MAHTQRPKDANFVPMPRRHALLTALALLLACALAPAPTAAQRTSSDKDGNLPSRTAPPSFSAPMVVLLVALITAFFFIGLFSVYIRHCGRDNAFSSGPTISAAALLALSRRQQQQQSGLDDAVVASFPTMKYAEAKELRVGGEDAALECAVCLSEFDDDELLRFLPKCSHAFHPDCIGEWLSGHVTCPVCRCNLEPEDPTSPDTNSADDAGVAQQEVAIDVNREGAEEEERRREAMDLERIGSQRRAVRSQSGRPLARSHSTGHSVAVRLDGDLERFTLRLPEHVRRGMVALGEESLRRSGRIVRRGGARSARLGRSDRWPSFISRTFSSRVPFWAASRRTADAEGAGEGSTASAARVKRTAGTASSGPSAKGSVRFDCLGGGGGGGGVSGARVGAVAGDEEGEEKAFARQV